MNQKKLFVCNIILLTTIINCFNVEFWNTKQSVVDSLLTEYDQTECLPRFDLLLMGTFSLHPIHLSDSTFML